METFTSMELYLMNGGNKQFIGRDGFWDVYHATPEEEAAWDQEIIQQALLRLHDEVNILLLKHTIDTLVFHQYKGLEVLLHQYLVNAIPARQIALAMGLWLHYQYDQGFQIIHQVLVSHRKERINDVFTALFEFKHHEQAKRFLVDCLEGDDKELAVKAQACIALWAYTGLPELREGNLTDRLKPEHVSTPDFKTAMADLKKIFFPLP